MSEWRRVVVTGLGAVTPVGNNVSETWNSLKNGKNGIAPITFFDTEGFKAKLAAEEAPKAEEAPAPAIAQSEAADEDFADDLELVAVISAAIAAYENTSGDSFVVRSIKKSNKWHRA